MQIIHWLILVDELLDGAPPMSLEEVDGESTMLLPQYHTSGDSSDEKLAKFVKWTVNINLLIVSITCLPSHPPPLASR